MILNPIQFDPNDPFPHLSFGDRNYRQEKIHAALVDDWLGLRVSEVEAVLRGSTKEWPNGLWIGLEQQAFLTPYTEIREILENLRPVQGQKFVDLGAGYGRVGHVIERCFAGVAFLGVEYVPQRCDEASRVFKVHGYSNSEMVCSDLSEPSYKPPAADHYFIYDYGTLAAVRKTLQDLRDMVMAGRHPKVIARGRGVRHLIDTENPWLGLVAKPRHFDRYSIYQS